MDVGAHVKREAEDKYMNGRPKSGVVRSMERQLMAQGLWGEIFLELCLSHT
jgi:hypothetical protein